MDSTRITSTMPQMSQAVMTCLLLKQELGQLQVSALAGHGQCRHPLAGPAVHVKTWETPSEGGKCSLDLTGEIRRSCASGDTVHIGCHTPADRSSLAGSTWPFIALKCNAFMSSPAAAFKLTLFASSSLTASCEPCRSQRCGQGHERRGPCTNWRMGRANGQVVCHEGTGQGT